MKQRRIGILLRQAGLELLVGFRHPALGGTLARLGFGQQFRATRLELLLGLTGALLELGFDEDVVEDAGDRKAQSLLDVVGVERDLEVRPQPLEVAGIEQRCGLVLEDEVLVPNAHNPVDFPGEYEAPGGSPGFGVHDRTLEDLLQLHDLELLLGIPGRVAPHHRGGQMPVTALGFIAVPVRAGTID